MFPNWALQMVSARLENTSQYDTMIVFCAHKWWQNDFSIFTNLSFWPLSASAEGL